MSRKLILLFLIVSQIFLAGNCKKNESIKVRDDAFYLALVRDGVDSNGDGIISIKEALETTTLDVSQGSISDMTGIGEFENLKELDCSSNQLTGIDLSGNALLEKLRCQGNRLKILDISFNPSLKELNCGGTACCGNNELTNLDLSRSTALEVLNCSNNKLTNLDVSPCESLQTLDFSYNHIGTIDISLNGELRELNCGSNALTSLDVSGNTLLQKLICYHNGLATLDISACTDLEYLVISDMPSLHTVCVSGNSLPPSSMKIIKYGSPNVIFTNDCGK